MFQDRYIFLELMAICAIAVHATVSAFYLHPESSPIRSSLSLIPCSETLRSRLFFSPYPTLPLKEKLCLQQPLLLLLPSPLY